MATVVEYEWELPIASLMCYNNNKHSIYVIMYRTDTHRQTHTKYI